MLNFIYIHYKGRRSAWKRRRKKSRRLAAREGEGERDGTGKTREEAREKKYKRMNNKRYDFE